MNDSAADAVELPRASQEWKSALIDVGGNNRLLHFKAVSSTIDLASATEDALARLLRGNSVPLREIFSPGDQLDRAVKAAAALQRKEREATEEYGVSVTYLALGFATWDSEGNRALTDTEAADTGEEDTTRVRRGPAPNAPVLLRSVEVTKRRGVTDDWQLRLGEDLQINGVLAHVLNSDRDRVDEEALLAAVENLDASADMSDARSTLEATLDELGGNCGDVAGFRTRPDLVVGTFTYQKQPMVNDVANMEALEGSTLAAALAGDAAAAERVRAAASDVNVQESDPDYTPVDSEFLVLDADASQSYVVNAALAGRNMVVQGPPGTGKSQTIANVIAGLVANGKHVLFVAQKRAAITSVLDRLEGADLSHLLLDLFATVGSRRFIAEQLRSVLERQQRIGAPDTVQLHAHLTASRRRLVGHKDALFRPEHGWGTSIYGLRAQSLEFAPDAQSPLRLHPGSFKTWDKTTLDGLASEIDELNRLGALAPLWGTAPGWQPAAMTSASEAERLRLLAQEARWTLLPSLQQHLTQQASLSGHGVPQGFTDADQLARLHHDAWAAEQVSPELLSAADVDAMIAATSRPHRREMADMTWKRRRHGKRQVAHLLSSVSPDQRLDLLLSTRVVRRAWMTGQAPTPSTSADHVPALLASLRQAIEQLAGATQGLSWGAMPFSELETALDGLIADLRQAQMVRAYALEQNLRTRGVGPVVDMLRSHFASGQPLRSSASDVLRWVCVRSVLEPAEISSPEIAGIRGSELSAAAEDFQRLDTGHLDANAARVRRQAATYLKRAFDMYPDQHSVLKTEVTRKRNLRSARRLFDEAPDVLLAAKPIWAMSPLQVSRILPAAQCFDVVGV